MTDALDRAATSPEGEAAPVSTPSASASAGTRGFLFSDLRGYTAFVERAGDQAAADLLSTYRALVREVIAAHDGAEIRTEGDSVYVVFPNASAAVEAGLGIIEAAASQSTPERPIRVGVGVHAGETVATTEGLVGGAVNIAARVCAKAQPGELLVTDTVRALTRTFLPYRYTSLGTQQLKGIAGGIPLYRVEITPTTTSARLRRQLIARRGRVALVVGLAIVLVAVGAGVYAANRAPDCLTLPATTKDVVAKIDPTRNCVVATYQVGAGPGPILAAGRGVWVGNEDDRSLTRVAGTELPRTIGAGGRITGLAADDTSLWVLDGRAATLTRIDLGSSRLIETYRLPGLLQVADPATIQLFERPDSWKLIGLGPATPQDVLNFVGGSYLGLTAGGGRLWVSNSTLGQVIRVDPSNTQNLLFLNPIGLRADSPPTSNLNGNLATANTGWLAIAGQQLWVGHTSDPGLRVVDLNQAGKNSTSVTVPGATGGTQAIVAGESTVWIAFAGGQVARLSTATRAGPSVVVGSDAVGLAVGKEAVWTGSQRDRVVVRIDPGTAEVTSRIPVGGIPGGVAIASDGSVWVTLQGP